MLSKILRHARQGTLLKAIGRKIFGYRSVDESAADAYYGDKAAMYVEKRLKEEKWHREQSIIWDLLNDVPDGSSVLDVPFGTGRFVEMYLQKGMSVHGLDISKDMLAAARQALGEDCHKCELHLGSADALPFDDDRFDLTVCCRFLGLIPFRMATKVLSELHRVSKSRVILYMNVRKDVFDWSRLVERVLVGLGSAPRYFKTLSGNIDEDRFLGMLKETGFHVQDKRVIRDDPKNTYLFYVLSKDRVPR